VDPIVVRVQVVFVALPQVVVPSVAAAAPPDLVALQHPVALIDSAGPAEQMKSLGLTPSIK